MKPYSKLEEIARSLCSNDDPSHDWLHVQRVRDHCHLIGPAVGARLEILLPACYLHDLVNVPKNHPNRETASRESAKQAQAILRECEVSEDDIPLIQTVIEEHSYSRGLTPTCIESAVMQDADRLDALGAIGIMRTITCGTKMGASYYSADEMWPSSRDHNDKQWMLDHFFTKLLKLEQGFHTEVARQLAEQRTNFMRCFLEQLKLEVQ